MNCNNTLLLQEDKEIARIMEILYGNSEFTLIKLLYKHMETTN